VSLELKSGVRLALLACALVVVLLGAQALAAFSAPALPTASTGATLGRTGFEYIGGLRKFAAASLWNRLEPQFHQYGEGKSIDQRLEFLPTMRLVQLLDPQFEQAYYVAAFMLARLGRFDTALEVARDGVANNPKSGILRSNYAQILLMQDPVKNLQEMLAQTEAGLSPDATWSNTSDQFEGYGTFATVLKLAGRNAEAAALSAKQKIMKEQDATIGTEQEN